VAEKMTKISELPVLTLWRFKLRRLAICRSERTELVLHSASRATTEQEAVEEIRHRFTPAWWSQYLIQDVEEVGQLHMVCGVPLYERD
jgi:hypothetical protein